VSVTNNKAAISDVNNRVSSAGAGAETVVEINAEVGIKSSGKS
jgi:hypothetical protein